MLLAILTIRKELHGFIFLCIRVVPFSIIMGLRLAAFGPPELCYKFMHSYRYHDGKEGDALVHQCFTAA